MSSHSSVNVSIATLEFSLTLKQMQVREPMDDQVKEARTELLQGQIADLKRGIQALQTFQAGGEEKEVRHNSLPQDCTPSSPSPLPYSQDTTQQQEA